MMVRFGFAGGLLVALLLQLVVVALPLKLAALFAGARRTGLLWCFLTAFVALFVGYLVSGLIGGSIGGPLAAALGFVIAIRFMLGTTLVSAVGLTVVAMGICLAMIWALFRLGVLQTAAVGVGTSI